MEPQASAVDVDAGFVGVEKFFPDESAFENRLEGLQQTESLAVEVEHGAGADRDAALIGEVVANAVVWHELLLGHVDRLSLHRVSVLNRPGYPSWKLRDELMALSVLHYLGSVFGHHFRDFDIDDLPGLKTHASILAARDGAPVDFDGFDPIWILFPLESRPVVPILGRQAYASSPSPFVLILVCGEDLSTAECCCWHCGVPVFPGANGSQRRADPSSPALAGDGLILV